MFKDYPKKQSEISQNQKAGTFELSWVGTMIFRKTNRRLGPGSRVGHMFPWEKNPCVQRFPKFIHWSMTAKVKLKRLPSARCGVTAWKFNSEFSLKSYHHPKRKGKDHLPTIIFHGRAVKLRGCKRKMISHFFWVCIYHFFWWLCQEDFMEKFHWSRWCVLSCCSFPFGNSGRYMYWPKVRGDSWNFRNLNRLGWGAPDDLVSFVDFTTWHVVQNCYSHFFCRSQTLTKGNFCCWKQRNTV